MADQKKIAVIVSDRPDEGLRMALGLTIEGDEIHIYNVGAPIERSEANNTNIDGLDMMDCTLISVNEADEGFTHMQVQEIPGKLLEYDHVVAY